jgi:recombination protein RecA
VERDKALDMALGQIEKQFGKGAIMRMGEDAKLKIPAISSGALSLDIALGIGGLPRGRVVEIYGPESSGKCVTGDTYIWSDRGLETVAEVFARCGQPASCTSRITSVADVGMRTVNERSELEPVAALTHNNRRSVLRICLQSGRTITVTGNHPLRVVNERGFIVWRPAERIATGDTVVSAAFGAVEAAAGDGLSEDEAALIGYLVAEGSLSNRSAIRFTNWDLEVGAEFTQLVEGLFGAEVRCHDGKEYAVHNTKLRAELADRYGLDYVTAHSKTVPQCVRTGGHKAQRAFLSALFEGDGWIDRSSTIGLDTASEQLAREVQLLLYGFGVPATVSSKYNAKYERDYWTVTVDPAVVHRFLFEIGFRSTRRRAQVEANFRRSPRDPQFENIPHVAGLVRDLRDDLGGDRAFDRLVGDLFRNNLSLACSRQSLTKIVDWVDRRADVPLSAAGRAILDHLRALAKNRYTYETVIAVEDGGRQPTFDLVLPETHSFIANGVLSHNTTVALHAIAEAQRAGGIAAFIDAEHALDPSYAAALGVDVESMLVSQPDTGEQALEITDMLIRSGAVDIVVIDSVAALTPRAEIEGEMGDSHVGLQARLMSQALRKLAGTLNRSRTCAIFINQLREKIGVMFGCLNWHSRVTLADGTQEYIGKIVNQRLPVEVLSYDPDLDAVVPKKVVNWFDNGVTEEFLHFRMARGGRGNSGFACTPNHLVRTAGGWREARDIRPGQRVMQLAPRRLSGFQWEVLLGGLMGDATLSPTGSGHSARLRWGHGVGQEEYADWKASLFANLKPYRSTNARGAVFHALPPLPELAELRQAVYFAGKKVLSDDYLKRLTPLSLAVWYMDDASLSIRAKGVQERTRDGSARVEICVEAMEPTSRQRLLDYLRDAWGVEARLRHPAGKAVLVFGKDAAWALQEIVAPYIHPSLEYKLLPHFRGRFDVEPIFVDAGRTLVPVPVLSVEARNPSSNTHRYDIEVEGSHNYVAGGVVVHNSPETTPGGRALKFYASVRLDVRRIESLKDGAEVVGNRVRVKVVKNKVAPPFRQAEFDIMYGEGISKEGSVIDTGVDTGIVRKAGAWYTYEGEQLGQGRENARKFLKEHDELTAEISKKILEHLDLVPTDVVGDTPE